MNLTVLKVSKKRKDELLGSCVREHIKNNTTFPYRITQDYILGVVIDYYLERR